MTEAPAMTTIVVDGVTKYAIAFPMTDENGQPLLDRNGKPRFSNHVADSEAELVAKIANSNIEVSRALERANRHIETLKNRKPTPKAAPADLKGKTLTAEEKTQIGLDTQDPRKAADAIARVVESVVPVDKITGEVQRQGQTIDIEARKRIAREFIGSHVQDYLPIEANNAMLNQWLIAQNLEFSVGNLEIAMANLGDKLVTPRRVVPPADNAPNPDNAPPDNAAPGNEPPNPGTPPSPQRRPPTSGISSSQVSDRPTAGTGLPYTRDQLLKMAMAQDPKYDALIRDPVKNAMVNRILSGRR